MTTVAAIVAVVAVAIAVVIHDRAAHPNRSPEVLPTTPASYLGIYQRGASQSYAGVDQLAQAIGRQPNLVTYYSDWLAPFQAGFATSAAARGAVPLVQINPTRISLGAIAGGQYDAYLGAFANAIRAYGHPVILGFGHEMNGSWYSWGYRHTSPATFVAAWRHIVTVFRTLEVRNVTWLWTINVIDPGRGIPDPAPWWPGRSYVTWVGIDGYYFKSSWKFAPLFGPTIKAVHALTRDPILIAETAAAPSAGKPAKITDLFAGIHAYGLLGFVWFDADGTEDWRIKTAAAAAALRRGAMTFRRP